MGVSLLAKAVPMPDLRQLLDDGSHIDSFIIEYSTMKLIIGALVTVTLCLPRTDLSVVARKD